MTIETLTIIGVGLIGGSIGLAAKRRGVCRRVLGVGRQEETLARALAVGAIDRGFLDAGEALSESDLAVFCTPVDRIADQVLSGAARCRPGTLLTDAGSTKAAIVHRIDGGLPREINFVGSHPLAGSEKRGPEHAHADLFQDRVTVVTPTGQTNPEAVERTCAFWRALGSRVRMMPPEEHDQALAVTSHLPHLLASALAAILPPHLQPLTATGFRDTTRVAAGDPSIWTGIFVQNRQAVLEALRVYLERLDEFRAVLDRGDEQALDELLAQAKRVRDALGS
jgi:cyclohexadieny/prephenate dehydrogenase